MYNKNTWDKQQKYFNKRLCGARVVTQNAYGIWVDGAFCTRKQNPDFSIYVTSSWHVLHNLTFVLTGLILANIKRS